MLPDYHLSPAEQQQVEKCVPMHQAKIHLAFHANIVIDDKTIKNGAVALSEHMITIYSPGFLRRSLKLYETFHLFDIKSVITLSNEKVRMDIKGRIIYIETQTCMRFVRNTLRNFILSNPSLPAPLRFEFRCHDPSFFPPFNPQLSPSQQFQFTYNAFCSYYDTTYYHDIPMYYHKLLSTGNCVFDLTKLPIKVLECGLGDSAEIKPITQALLYSPFVFGFSCAHFVRPDIISAISPLIQTNQALRMVRIVDAGAEKGAIDVANAMLKSKNQNIIYWDFSQNKLSDLLAFAQALGNYEAEIKAIILNDCDMTDMTVATLLQSLTENEDMHSIEELSLIGSRVNSSNCELFCDFLEELANSSEEENSGISLKILGLSSVEDPGYIIETLQNVNAQLITFKLHDTVFNDDNITSFCSFLESQKKLQKLSLEGCSVSVDGLNRIISVLGVSEYITKLDLSLARLNLSAKNFEEVFQSILQQIPLKLNSLNLDGNNMSVANLEFLCQRIHALEQLKSLSLSQNFSSSMKGISNQLCQLIHAPLLEELIIRGDDSHKLKSEMIQFICCLQTFKTLNSLDISFNSIGDLGLETLSNLVISSLRLKQVSADGSDPSSFASIDRFLYVLETDAELINAPLPVEDVYTLVSDKEEKQQQRHIENITTHQMRLEDMLMKNRALAGVHSDLTLLKDQVLDDLLDESTLKMQEMLQNVNLTQHLAITEIVGLPLPFEKETNESKDSHTSSSEEGDGYVDPKMMIQIKEKDDYTAQFQTLQFNSLLIRRPNAAERLAHKGALFIQGSDHDSEEYEDYDEEEETQGTTKKGHKLLPSKIELLAPVEFDVESAPNPNEMADSETEMKEPDIKQPLV